MAENRWWENYLVRYFMPSIAGAVIVAWLVKIAGDELRLLLYLPSTNLTSPDLLLLFLYGNLYCYIASYPILCFHATRVLDFPFPGSGRSWALNGYGATLLAAIIVGALGYSIDSEWPRLIATLAIIVTFTLVQVLRVHRVLTLEISIQGVNGKVTAAFAYTYSLARRRGLIEQSETRQSKAQQSSGASIPDELVFDSSAEKKEITRWRREVIDTYRHLREHGNSAFIFILELLLAGACYGIVTLDAINATAKMSLIGILFAVWAAPSMLVHFLAQAIERRFSWFDLRF